jgi:peptidoglycan hydrolase CwlO-like protein
MRKLIIVLLVIVSFLLVGCKSPTGKVILQTEKVCECPNIDLSEYDKRIEDLQEQTRTLRKQLGVITNELYATNEFLNVTKSSQEELEQLRKELENDIERVDTRIDIQNCRSKGGEFVNNECRMPLEKLQEWVLA